MRSSLLLLLLAAPVIAQDMPLSQVLIDGEGWKPATVSIPKTEVVTRSGMRYFVDAKAKAVRAVSDKRMPGIVAEGFAQPTGIALSPDGGTLVVADAAGKHLYAFRVEKDGTLTCKEPYYTMRLPNGQKASGAGGMCFDSDGRLYVASTVGVQCFDPTGRMNGVLLNPISTPPTAVTMKGNTLFIQCGDKVFARKVKSKEVGEKK